MAKNKGKAKALANVVDLVFLQELADKMNKLIEYEVLDDGGVDEGLNIDVDMSESALKAEILKRAKKDIYEGDNENFTADEWSFFIDNGVTPKPEDALNADDTEIEEEDPEEEDPEEEDPEEEDPEEEDPEEEEKPAAKKKAALVKKESKPEKEKKAPPKRSADGVSREDLVAGMIKDGATFADVLKKLTAVYVAAGKSDEGYIESRAKIYWNIGCKKNGMDAAIPKKETTKKEPPAKEQAQPKTNSGKKAPQKPATGKKK